VDVVSGGTELEPQFKTGEFVRLHTLAIKPTSSVLEFIVHKQCIVLFQVNRTEFKSRIWVSSLPLTLADSPASYKAARQRSIYFCRLQLEHKAATVTYVNPHIAGVINI